MSTEFNELLQCSGGNQPHGDNLQIWIVGSREQVIHTINEFHVKRVVIDRSQFRQFSPKNLPSS
jgi:hypothetical protein